LAEAEQESRPVSVESVLLNPRRMPDFARRRLERQHDHCDRDWPEAVGDWLSTVAEQS